MNINIFEYYDKTRDYNMNVFSYIPKGNKEDMKIIFVMSGCLRDALNYLKNWIEVADKYNYIIVAPEFDKDHYSIAEHEYGNLIDIEYDYSSQDIYIPYMKYGKTIKDKSEWIYDIIDNIYLKFIKENTLKNDGFIIFGHSSGAQFVHKYLMLGDSKYCKLYLAANAGLYTFFNEEKDYPYGIKNLNEYKNIIDKSLSKKAYIMIGDQDITTDDLNHMEEDKEEGLTRLERGTNYYNIAKEYSNKNNIDFNWNLIIMPNVNHDNKKVVPYACEIINKEV